MAPWGHQYPTELHHDAVVHRKRVWELEPPVINSEATKAAF